MIDRRQIVALYARGDAVALVTLIRVEGSSYRRAGARLLICANGEYAGSISGGCLEAEVIRKAQWLTRDGATIQRYSTLFDDTADIPFGLGCGGTVDLLIEPAQTPECDALIAAMHASLEGHTQQVTTTLPTATGPMARTIHSNLKPLSSHLDRAPQPLQPDKANTIHETLHPPQCLTILGAGDDARPMADFAVRMGWAVTVVDSRPQWAKPERFPTATSTLCINPPSLDNHAKREGAGDFSPLNSTLQKRASAAENILRVGTHDAVVIMTHSYEQDRAWLSTMLPLEPCYLGLLGARHRSALLVSEAAAVLDWPLERACEGLFAPIGLDLGGDGPEAIALATIAEIHARVEGKLGVSRRLTPQMVEEQIASGGASRYLQTQCAI